MNSHRLASQLLCKDRNYTVEEAWWCEETFHYIVSLTTFVQLNLSEIVKKCQGEVLLYSCESVLIVQNLLLYLSIGERMGNFTVVNIPLTG